MPQNALVPVEDGRSLRFERVVTLSDSSGRTYQSREASEYRIGDASDRSGEIVELSRLTVPPGAYKLTVQTIDSGSTQWGIYTQDLVVPACTDTVSMSDLQVAWAVTDREQKDVFRKEDVWVVPMPSRSFLETQPVHLYYELYGMGLDTFGRSRYTITYTVEQNVRSGAGVFGAVGGFFKRAVQRQEPDVSINYEAVGDAADEAVYLEIDADKLKRGYNRIAVTVTDQVRGKSSMRSTIVHLGG